MDINLEKNSDQQLQNTVKDLQNALEKRESDLYDAIKRNEELETELA